jgi:hypothetical protein
MVLRVRRRGAGQGADEPAGLGYGRRDLIGVLYVSVCGGQDQQGEGDHGQGGEPVPCPPAAYLVMAESDLAFRGLERFLDRPAGSCDAHQVGQRGRVLVVGAVIGRFAGVVVAADQQAVLDPGTVLSGVCVGVDPGPVVPAWPLGPGSCAVALPMCVRAGRRRCGRRAVGCRRAGRSRGSAGRPGRSRSPGRAPRRGSRRRCRRPRPRP